MTDLTLLEASRALGTTKNTVKYHIKKLPEGMVYKAADGKQHITAQGLELLRKTIDGTAEIAEEPIKTDSEPSKDPALIEALSETIAILKAQLEEKDRQLTAKSEEITQLMKLLDQSQTLQRAEQVARINPPIDALENEKPRAGWFGRWRK